MGHWQCVMLVITILSCVGQTFSSYFKSADYLALQELYNETQGESWTWNSPYSLYGIPWNFNLNLSESNPCEANWQGLNCSGNCSSSPCLILKISLGYHNLRGRLPNSLAILSDLQNIILNNNALTGPIPSRFEELQNLTSLNLANNRLNGTIPANLGTYSNLSEVDLSSNQLSGEFPSSVGNWIHLTQFSISNNLKLNGSLPSSLGKLSNMKSFSAARCSLDGQLPISLGNWTHIQLFDIAFNSLSGPIPLSFSSWSIVETVDMGSNSLTGQFPSFITQFSRLATFDVSNNELKGTLPSNNWQNLVVLQSFVVYNNKLYGQIPFQIFNDITSLVDLGLNGNMFSQTLPSTGFQNYDQLTVLSLDTNYLTGTLPAWLFSVQTLEYITINNNAFHGTIPNVFFNSSQLYSIIGSYNRLTGTLPSSWNDVATLGHVSFLNNLLHGTISPHFVRNTQLFSLVLGNNLLSGTIPHNFGDWPSIFLIDWHDNHLNGTIPSTFFDGRKLSEIYLQGNYLEGKIVHLNFSNLPQAAYLSLFQNLLTGSIPESVSHATLLSSLLLFDNLFTGTLPRSLTTMPLLTTFAVSHNLLHGDISFFLLNTMAGEMIDLSHNSFTGPFEVKAYDETHSISILDFCYNSLTGTMPMNITTQTIMHLLFVNDNQMYGVLPEKMKQLTGLQYLNVSSNYFEGKPENFITPQGAFGFINLANNYFSGTINNVFNQLKHLFMLIVFSNFFTGPIDTLFDPQTQLEVMKVDVSGNYLTGTVPGWLFTLPMLQSVIAATNCITGSIPSEACSAENLTSLVLDGLHASLSCNRKLFTWQTRDIYYLAPGVNMPSVPSCLFSLPQIRLLHMSGNGIRGKLDPNIQISPTLSELDISQNSLSGPIPSAIYHHFFQTLDLSFNQFNGTIPSTIVVSSTHNVSGVSLASYSSLKLQVNRLSGSIPASVRQLQDINILEGNMFSCHGDEKLLPHHDPKHASYDCGSDSTNVVLIAWICTVAGVLLVTVFYFRFVYHSSLRAFISSVQATIAFSAAPVVNECIMNEVMAAIPRAASLAINNQGAGGSKPLVFQDLEQHPSTSKISVADIVRNPLSTDSNRNSRDTFCESITKPLDQRLTAFTSLIITSLPKSIRDISRSTIYTNHLHIFYLENQFLRKFLVMVCMFVFVVMMAIYASLKGSYGTYTIQYVWDLSFAYLKGVPPSMTVMVVLFVLVIAMHTVVNMHLFLKHSTRNAIKLIGNSSLASTSSTPAITAISPTAYKVNNWKFRHLSLLLIFLANCTVVLLVNGAYVLAVNLNYSRTTLQFISFLISVFKLSWSQVIVLGLIENLTVQLLSPTRQSLFLVVLSIFNNIVAPYAAEAFVSADCFEYALTAAPADTSTITSEACFLYSTTFTAQNASMVCNQNLDQMTLLISALSNSATTVSFNPPFSYSFQCSSTLVSVFSNVFVVRYLLSGVVQPILLVLVKKWQLYCLHRYGIGSFLFRKVSEMMPILMRPIAPSEILGETQSTTEQPSQVMDKFDLTNDAVFHNLTKRFTLRKAFTVRMISDLAVLLTFGLFFPPLAVVVTFSMIVEITIVEYGMGHIAQLATLDQRPQSQLRNFLYYLNDTFDGFGDGIWKFFPYLMVFCAIFWSFSFFDTLGDDVGAISVAWVFPLVICFPIVVELLVTLTLKLYGRISSFSGKIERNGVINAAQDTSLSSYVDSQLEMSTVSKD